MADALTKVSGASLMAPSRKQSAQQAALLVRAGAVPALAKHLRPRAGWALARAAALQALTCLLLGLTTRRQGENAPPRPEAATFVDAFVAAGGVALLGPLLPRSTAALKLFTMLVARRPALLSEELHEPLAAAMMCRFGLGRNQRATRWAAGAVPPR